MKKLLGILVLGLLLSGNALSDEAFSNWIKSLELKKPIFQDKLLYTGVGYTGEPNHLKNLFPILVSFIYDEVYSDDKRYVVRTGCKPRDCGNKGLLWVDLEKKVAIGVIRHSFWEKLDFNNRVKDQIFIFSNFYENPNKLPKEFVTSYSNWIAENEITPSKYRFLNSNNEIEILKNNIFK
tara:strand:+ start:204 stop:743 length:540 start_codon:yes stop_codon:yes gene_type:complete